MTEPAFAVMADIYRQPEEQIAQLAAQGVTALEGWYEPLQDNPPSALRRWRQSLERAGVRLWSVHAPFGGQCDLASADEAERRSTVTLFSLALERAAEVGASLVVVHGGNRLPEEADPAESERRASEELAKLVDVAQRTGVRIALENLLPRHPGEQPDPLLQMIADLPPRWVGVCFDTGHAHITGDVLAAFATLQERIISFHVHDNDQHHDLHLPPGYGSLPWDQFCPLVRRTGFADPIVLECRPWRNGDWRNLLKESRALFTQGLQRYQDSRGEAHLRCTRCGHFRFCDETGWFCACEPASSRPAVGEEGG